MATKTNAAAYRYINVTTVDTTACTSSVQLFTNERDDAFGAVAEHVRRGAGIGTWHKPVVAAFVHDTATGVLRSLRVERERADVYLLRDLVSDRPVARVTPRAVDML